MELDTFEKDRAEDIIDEMKRMGYKTKRSQIALIAVVIYLLSEESKDGSQVNMET